MNSSKDLVKVNRKINDSVFTDLFSNIENAALLVQQLHPELGKVECDDLVAHTLTTTLTEQNYNDFAVSYRDKYMIFVEQQSTYNPNIGLRLLIYAQETLKRWVSTNASLDIYSTKRLEVPNIEFYCVCTYQKKEDYPDYETFGDGMGFLHVRVKMLYPNIEEKNIISEYVSFIRGASEIKLMTISGEEKVKLLSYYIDDCIRQGVLANYLNSRKQEVIRMIDILFDQQFVLERHISSEKAIAKDEGRAEGKAEGKAEERINSGCRIVSLVMEANKCSFEEAIKQEGYTSEEAKLIKERLENQK